MLVSGYSELLVISTVVHRYGVLRCWIRQGNSGNWGNDFIWFIELLMRMPCLFERAEPSDEEYIS